MDGYFKKDTGHSFRFSHSFFIFFFLNWSDIVLITGNNHWGISEFNRHFCYIHTIQSPIAHPSPYFPLFTELYSSPQPINSLIKTPLYTIVMDCFIELDIQKNRSSLLLYTNPWLCISDPFPQLQILKDNKGLLLGFCVFFSGLYIDSLVHTYSIHMTFAVFLHHLIPC